MESRVVTGYIGPIKANRIKLGRMSMILGGSITADPPVDIVADPSHPITRDMLEQLPRLNDAELLQVRELLSMTDEEHEKRGRSWVGSTPIQVASWLSMVDEEIRFRARERRGLYDILKATFKRG